MHALFVGHGHDARAADICHRYFIAHLIKDPDFLIDTNAALIRSCAALDALVLAQSTIDRLYYGATLICTVIFNEKIYVANVGNSNVHLISSDSSSVRVVTTPHDASNAHEKARVESAGAFFENEKVNNLIRVTRSIGDLEMKASKHIVFPHLNLCNDVLISTPDVFTHHISNSHRALIMSTPELFDLLTDNILNSIIVRALAARCDAHACAEQLASAAVRAGASHFVTVLVVLFAHSPKNRWSIFSPRASSTADRRGRGARKPGVEHISPTGKCMPASRDGKIETFSPSNSASSAIVRRFVLDDDAREPWCERSDSCFASLASPSSPVSPDVPPSRGRGPPITPRKFAAEETASDEDKWDKRAMRNVSGVPSDETTSRKQIDIERCSYAKKTVSVQKRTIMDGRRIMTPRAKTSIEPTMSEVTVSGTMRGTAQYGQSLRNLASSTNEQQMDYSQSGPSKVRYKDDGLFHFKRLDFFSDVSRIFSRRR